MGKPLIMGRRTFQSLKKPLDGRDNIVVTRDESFRPDGAIVVPSFEMALARARDCAEARGADEIMVIGGADVFADTIDDADRLEITRVHLQPEGDTLFPPIDPQRWHEVSRVRHQRGPGDDADFTTLTYQRIR
jgi:dihydrofolate reductase